MMAKSKPPCGSGRSTVKVSPRYKTLGVQCRSTSSAKAVAGCIVQKTTDATEIANANRNLFTTFARPWPEISALIHSLLGGTIDALFGLRIIEVLHYAHIEVLEFRPARRTHRALVRT